MDNAGVHIIGVLVTAGLLMIIFKGAGGFLPKEGTKETWNKKGKSPQPLKPNMPGSACQICCISVI